MVSKPSGQLFKVAALLCWIGVTSAFSLHPKSRSSDALSHPLSPNLFSFQLCSSSKDDNLKDDDGEDDEEDIRPYKERSLAWTKRYRKLVPYDAARLTAMRLGLRSKEEWDDIRNFGKAFHGAHLVSRPDLMYAKEWISWDEFLGVMRPYDEAKYMVQSELNLCNMEEYTTFLKENVKLAESLRIPAKPEIVYRNKGWTGPDDFFGQ